MKKLLFFLFISLSFIFFQCTPKKSGQMTTGKGNHEFRKTPPVAGKAPKIELGKYEQFTMDNGLQVIVVENDKLPKVSFQLLVDLPPIFQGNSAGYIDFMGELLTKGTQNKSKSEIDEIIDFMGASLNSRSDGVFGSSLKRHSDELFALLAEVVMKPSFPQEEFEKLKTRTKSALAAAKEDPNAIAANVAKVLTYTDKHPYGEVTTEETIENIRLDMCRAYYEFFFRPNVSYLAIVGDISTSEARAMVEKHLGSWEPQDVDIPKPDLPKFPGATTVNMVDKPGAVQSVVSINYPVELKHNAPDRMAAMVMNTLLGGFFSSRINQNVREDKGYTYGARSSLNTDQYIGSFSVGGSFGTAVTDSAIQEILYEINRMRDEMITDQELELVKATAAGNFARSLERPQTIANFALNIARYDLPKDYYETYLDRLEAITKDEVRAAAIKYLRPEKASILIVGNKSQLEERVARFDHNKEVHLYDEYGNSKETTDLKNPAGMTVEKVFQAYIDAIGGMEKLSIVNTLSVESTGNISGMILDATSLYMLPDKMIQEMGSKGQVMQTQIVNGDVVKVTQMGNSQVIKGEEANSITLQAHPFPEMNLMKDLSSVKLLDPQVINGKNCYVIEVSVVDGSPMTFYYDMETGYKIRMSNVITMGDQVITQATDYEEYTDVGRGVFYPMSTRQSGGGMPMSLTLKVTNIVVNPELDATRFEIN